ncbi:hypothetical protein LOC67_09405 [Stieleria sp. JC731]|uniref:hypothetical protein n=1 Tax=Pirellulaceae TaxID=2691357 RepID=UPI001E3C2FFA|nr:hypothetical protein [Stieleria sp. JC731]MCC9600780.1 hypothetical protein [Stieleria sp. JC731]
MLAISSSLVLGQDNRGAATTPVSAGSSSKAQASKAVVLASDLFSTITMSQTVAQAQSLKPTEDPVVGEVSLARFFDRNKIENQIESQWVRVSTSAFSEQGREADSWTTIAFAVDADAKRIDGIVQLNESMVNALQTNNNLITAMMAFQSQSNIHFIGMNGSLAIHTSIGSENLKIESVKQAADRLIAARSTIATMNLLSSEELADEAALTENSSQSPASGIESKPVQANVAQAQASNQSPATVQVSSAVAVVDLVGTWSAKVTESQAWAIRLNADKSFALVHTQGGKNQVSQGSFKIENDKLILQGSGLTLKGGVTLGNKSLAWQLENATGTPTIKLNFKKQS